MHFLKYDYLHILTVYVHIYSNDKDIFVLKKTQKRCGHSSSTGDPGLAKSQFLKYVEQSPASDMVTWGNFIKQTKRVEQILESFGIMVYTLWLCQNSY